MKSLKKRLILDAALAVILIAEMLVQLTGAFLHEIIGVVLLVTVIVHLVFERAWISKTFMPRSGAAKLSPKHMAKLVVVILMLVDVILLGFSSVMISTLLFDAGARFDDLYLGGVWYLVHALTAYAFCALVVIHLAIHWNLVVSNLRVSYDEERRAAIGQGVGAVATLGVIALGVASINSDNVQRWFKANEEAEANSSVTTTTASSSSNSNAATNSNSSKASSTGSTSSADGTGNTSGSGGAGSTSGASGSGGASTPDNASGEDSTSSSSSTSATGTCPLCPKRCSLSNPQCEKPYNAGLISR